MKRVSTLPSLDKQARNLKSYMNLNSISLILLILSRTKFLSTYFEEGKNNFQLFPLLS